ncbi:unnamed protein product, partial [Mesorhabditis belari]|uniref:Uncharacterized protein n=1 Tax=Mesorhabditis belari TaxID=2138241 RepID=A0AAF3EWM3_9BILA
MSSSSLSNFSLYLLGGFLFFLSTSPFVEGGLLKRNEIAPSLVWERLIQLQNSIDKLAEANRAVRCRVPALTQKPATGEHQKTKRFVGPSQRLEELINPFVLHSMDKRFAGPSQRLEELINPLVLHNMDKRFAGPSQRLEELINPLGLHEMNKRFAGPSQRLEELINPLVLHQMNKRYVGPSQRLEELINPLSLGAGYGNHLPESIQEYEDC